MRRLIGWITAGVLLLALGPGPAKGQETSRQLPAPQQPDPGRTITSVSPNPYEIYNRPAYPQVQRINLQFNPAGGYLEGIASIIQAQGQFALDQQQALLEREKVVAARLNNRRQRLEQWLWERENLPTLEDDRERFRLENLRRARNDPPITEIWSGKALNDLLLDLERITSAGGSAAAGVPLEPELLAKINVTSGKADGNVALFRAERIPWPHLLRRPEFAADVASIEELKARAVAQASAGQRISFEVVEGMRRHYLKLRRTLTELARLLGDKATWTPHEYIQASQFLNHFNNGLTVLQEPDGADYLSDKLVPKARTVGDLVKYMKDHGLRFAPSTAGQERFYTALHQKLADLSREAGQRTRDPK